ncbi:hypothetical protein ABT024_23625 [Streptomyces sp. NPDC002812]|uniref:hypothetical protein n=1 Tax=Streptomyces sp. NPDC002812 TaxID=3154434 RepID=UPI0033278175
MPSHGGGGLAIRPCGIGSRALYEPPFVVDGTRPPLPADYVDRVELASHGDNYTLHTLPGQTHAVDPQALAPVLTAFFTGLTSDA